MKRFFLLIALAVFAPLAAWAQSTATPVVPGYLNGSGQFIQCGSSGCGGGGSSGNVTIIGPLGAGQTQSTSVWTTDYSLGISTTSPCSAYNTSGCTAMQELQLLNQLAGSATPAGTNIVGKFGIDQTTPGTTNAVAPSATVGAATFTPGSLAGSPLTVTSTATEVAAARTGVPGTGRVLLIIENESSTVALRCGGSSVTFAGGTGASAGIYLPATVGASINLPTTSAVYCIASSTSGTVSVAEVY